MDIGFVQYRGGAYPLYTRTVNRNDGTTSMFDVVSVRGARVACDPDCETAIREELARQQDSGGDY